MSGSYGSLLGRYNTLYALYLDISGGSGGGVLQSVLDAGNTAIDIGIDLGNIDLSITSQITNSNVTFEGTDLKSSSLSRTGLLLDTDGVNEVTIDKDKLQITPAGTLNQAILSGTSLSLLDGTNVFSVQPTFLNVVNTANGDTLNFNTGALRVERTSSGFPVYSLLQSDNIACVNYQDLLTSNQCVISSGGIVNSAVVNGTYINDITHYNANDMKLTTNEGILDINSNYINFAGTSSNWGINPSGLNMVDVSGNQNFIGGGNIQIQAPTGEYLGITAINGIDINGNTGSANQVLAKDPSNNMTWQTLGTTTTPDLSAVLTAGAIASKSIDMNGFDISGVSTIITDPLGTNMTGQFTFDTPPHVPEPILGNDATPKGYVDSLVGQYAGGFNLFFNYSQTDASYVTFKALSQLVSPSAGEIVPTTINTGNNFIAQFITEPLGIDTIPIGLWDAFVYGAINAIGGDVHYFFELWKKTALNVDTLLGTSGISPDVNASPNNNPTSYSMILTIPTAIPLELNDRLYIIIYASYNGSTSRSLSTYFEGNYYSFVQTSLNAGTTLLSSNNTWTGINNFVLPPKTPYQVTTPANTDIVNYQQVNEIASQLISEVKIVSTLQYFISQTSPFFQYPPQQPTSALLASYQYYGWYFINSVSLRKIDWFFAPDYAMTVADVKGLYMNYFNITTTSNENLPFISIYTKPTGSGDIIPGFAHSVMTYIANFNPLAATPYCSFMNISGIEPDPFPYGHILGDMIQKPFDNPRGEYLPTEEILAIAVSTNSTSLVNQVNFIMGKVGICLEQGNQELILNPLDILLVPTISQVLTSGSVASNQNVSGINTLTATKLVTPTIDNSGGAITIGANNTALTLGKLATITNIQGNLQIAGSAGSNAQVLTSNGTTAEWQTPSGGSWVGTATSNLDMGIYNISGAVLDNSGGLVTIGANTTGLTLGKTAVTTNIKGNLQINSATGTSGQVLTSAGSGSAPTWQTPAAGSASLAVVKVGPVLSSSAFAGGSNKGVYNNNFLNITPPTLTATYLIKCQLTCNNQGTNASLFGNLGIQAGGGAQTTAAINAFNGLAMSAIASFSQTNSLSQCSVNTTSVFSQLSFTYIHTPATLSTLSYALWTGTTGNGAATIFSMEIIQIIA
jgi:hypothetical protein